jgi:hypothetical protein
VAYGDFPLIVKGGSAFDQAIAAYGVMRNTNNGEGELTKPEELRILIDKDCHGFLAVDIPEKGWYYIDFVEKDFTSKCPKLISYSFNEIEVEAGWIESPQDSSTDSGILPIIPCLIIIVVVAVTVLIILRRKK